MGAARPVLVRPNLLLNPALTGGPPPTSWTIGFGTAATTVDSVAANGDVRYKHVGTAQRAYLSQTYVLAANTTYTMSVFFDTGTSANQEIVLLSAPPGTTGTLSKVGGVIAAGRYSLTFSTAATAGNVEVRIGLGCSSAGTGTVIYGSPKLEIGASAT